MTWTRCSGTRSTCSSRGGRTLLLGPGAPLPPAQDLSGGAGQGLCLPACCRLLVAAWLDLGHSWAGTGASRPPLDGKEAAPLSPSHWLHCCCLLSVGTPGPLCGLSLAPLHGKEGSVALPVSWLTCCPSSPWPSARDPKPFLLPGLQDPALAPVSLSCSSGHAWLPPLPTPARQDGWRRRSVGTSQLVPAYWC